MENRIENLCEKPVEYSVEFYCSECHAPLKVSTIFCPKCGKKIERSALSEVLQKEIDRIDEIRGELQEERRQLKEEEKKKEEWKKKQTEMQNQLAEFRENLRAGTVEAPEEIRIIEEKYHAQQEMFRKRQQQHEKEKKILEQELADAREQKTDVEEVLRQLLAEVEETKLYCPVCGMYVGKRKYCGKCGYLMRKEDTGEAVSKV